jgi:GAF domain
MKIQNLPELLELLEQAAAGDRGSRAQLPPVGHEALARRAEHFDSSVHFGLDEPDAMQRLHAVTKDLRAVAELDALLPKVLEGALSLTGADFGTVQIFDPAAGSLKIVTQAGFGSEFLEYFAVVDDDACACGRAAQEGAQVVIVDVNADAGFARHRDIAASAGFRTVQSTPLVDYAGRLIGMVSTHFRPPHRPSDRDLRVMELYGDFAGEAVRQRLGTSARPDASAPVGQAVVSALLDHDDGLDGNVSVPFELWLMGRMTASLARRTRPASRRTT